MSFIAYPADPAFISESEKDVYGHLIDQLPDDAEVFCNIEYFDGLMRSELDFLIAIPDLGLIALEVKGGPIRIEGQDWQQWDKAKNKFVTLNLVSQLDAERRMVKSRLKNQLNKLPAIAWFAVFTDVNISEWQDTPGIDRNLIISKFELPELYRIALTELKRIRKDRTFTVDEQDAVREEFGSAHDDYSFIVESAESRAQLVDSISVEQMYLLDLLEDNNRILIKGGPGSGKTILAVEHAVRLAEEGKRVGLVCFNRGLGKMLQFRIDRLEDRKKPYFVGSLLDDIPKKWNFDASNLDKSDPNNYYSRVLPNALLNLTKNLQPHQKVDAWIVDEAQDLKAIHWQILQESLKVPETGIIHAFGDNEQNLFKGADDLPWFYAIGRLKGNLRSSQNIARILKVISQNAGDPAGPLVGSTPELVFIDDHDLAEAVADKYVDILIKDFDWQPGDIAVVTTRQRHTKQEAQQNDIDKYWADFLAGDQVMYTNVNSFKGLERPVVIVAVNGIPSGTDAAQRLYVAMSRARDDLILIGTRDELQSISECLYSFNEIQSLEREQ